MVRRGPRLTQEPGYSVGCRVDHRLYERMIRLIQERHYRTITDFIVEALEAHIERLEQETAETRS